MAKDKKMKQASFFSEPGPMQYIPKETGDNIPVLLKNEAHINYLQQLIP